MARPKKNPVRLTDEELKTLEAKTKGRGISDTARMRCRILILLDENHQSTHTYTQCKALLGVSSATIATVVKEYSEGGIDKVLSRKPNPNAHNALRKVDGRVEARLIATACSPAPEGRSRWTLKLLEKEMKVVLDTSISRETIRLILKKINFDLTKINTGAFQKLQMQSL